MQQTQYSLIYKLLKFSLKRDLTSWALVA